MTLDRDLEVRNLRQADIYIAKAEATITTQRVLLAELRRNERDTTEAERLLNGFEQTLATMVDHCKIIVNTIAQIDAGRI